MPVKTPIAIAESGKTVPAVLLCSADFNRLKNPRLLSKLSELSLKFKRGCQSAHLLSKWDGLDGVTLVIAHQHHSRRCQVEDQGNGGIHGLIGGHVVQFLCHALERVVCGALQATFGVCHPGTFNLQFVAAGARIALNSEP